MFNFLTVDSLTGGLYNVLCTIIKQLTADILLMESITLTAVYALTASITLTAVYALTASITLTAVYALTASIYTL